MCDRFCCFCLMTAFEESAPGAQSRSVAHRKSHFFQDGFIQSLSLHQDRHFIDGRRINALYNGIFIHVTEKGYLLA